MSSQATTIDNLEGFTAFLRKNNLDVELYKNCSTIPRYIRFNPRMSDTKVEDVEEQLTTRLQPVPWLSGFYSLVDDVGIAGSPAYKQGRIYGLDAASGAAVEALDIQPGNHVLDLCTAPGAKLCMMGDLLGSVGPGGSVTGVDCSRPRLAACRTLITKYQVPNARLFLADGQSFNVPPPPPSASMIDRVGSETASAPLTPGPSDGGATHQGVHSGREDETGAKGGGSFRSRKKQRRALKLKEGKKGDGEDGFADVCGDTPELFFSNLNESGDGLKAEESGLKNHESQSRESSCAANHSSGPTQAHAREVEEITGGSGKETGTVDGSMPSTPAGYDRVLVDAECTHDGSIKHILKYDKWGWETFERRFLNPERIEGITKLQRQLLRNGLGMLREGGRLVYSTCSLTRAQNEEVVQAILKESNGTYRLVPATNLHNHPSLSSSHPTWPCETDPVTGCVRFHPATSNTSGLFIACFQKSNSAAEL